jgi:hypothetical protein
MMRGKSSYSFLRSLVKGQDHSFFKDLMGIFCTIGGTLVKLVGGLFYFLASFDLFEECVYTKEKTQDHSQLKLKHLFTTHHSTSSSEA